MTIFFNDLKTRDQEHVVVCQDSQRNWGGNLELHAGVFPTP